MLGGPTTHCHTHNLAAQRKRSISRGQRKLIILISSDLCRKRSSSAVPLIIAFGLVVVIEDINYNGIFGYGTVGGYGLAPVMNTLPFCIYPTRPSRVSWSVEKTAYPQRPFVDSMHTRKLNTILTLPPSSPRPDDKKKGRRSRTETPEHVLTFRILFYEIQAQPARNDTPQCLRHTRYN